MPIRRVEVNEYECIKCSYKWVSRVNGQDRPKPIRCAKCKRIDWNERYDARRTHYVYAVRKKFGYWHRNPKQVGEMILGLYGGWRTEDVADKFLAKRPTVDDMKTVLRPMCYMFEKQSVGKIIEKDDGTYVVQVDREATDKMHEHEKDLGHQLMQSFISGH